MEGRVHFGLEFEGLVHQWRECVATGVWSSWSHCIQSQETEHYRKWSHTAKLLTTGYEISGLSDDFKCEPVKSLS